jgi:exodeoxyribonuclease V beta subunit
VSSADQPLPFDIRLPLSTGVTVLEASAGTGKTYTIAGLAARYVAEGTPLDRLLIVTFTRMATAELRERVRERLITVRRGLLAELAGVASNADDHEDEVVRLLAEGPAADVQLRCDRLSRAVSDFDSATITTTHGFCQEALSGLGLVADVERDAVFVEDVSDIADEVIDDLYVRRFRRGGPPPFNRSQAAEIARIAIANPTAAISPAPDGVPAMRRRLALVARREFDFRKRRNGIMTYDDLLLRLDDALTGAEGAAAAARLRARFDVVLVDEFQDADPVQWNIVRRAFGGHDGALILIGDPKQALYAFRGADVYAYLDAKRSATTHATLEVNRRSDQGLIDAYDITFGGAKLGHEGIVYRRVRAARANQESRLMGAPQEAPLRIRVVRRDEPSIEHTARGYATAGSARDHIAKDVAADVVALLRSKAEIERRAEDGTALGRDAIRPGHVGVLVPTNRTAALIRNALADAGVPAVINGAGSVFGTPQAREWLRLLEALERPSSMTRAHSAALTTFLGGSAMEVATQDANRWELIHERLHDWARLLRVNGVAYLTEAMMLAEGLPERLLAADDGERRLTDLRHIAQLLHQAARTDQLGTTALTAWLRRRIAEAKEDTTNEERSRRLESDAEAVQVLTIHRSKGLEFPIVYLPFLWQPGYIPENVHPVFFHDSDAGDARTMDVALAGSEFGAHRRQSVIERRGEDLRLMYVALTRARHQATIWWVTSKDSRNSPLGRLLFARDPDGNIAAEAGAPPEDADAIARFESLAVEADGCIAVELSTLGHATARPLTSDEPVRLAAAVFDRNVDRRWRRTSYSGITAAAHESWVASEPDERVVVDEPPSPTPLPADAPEMPAQPSPLSAMPVGLNVGTLVHRVFEAVDFAADDLDADLVAQIRSAEALGGFEVGDHAEIAGGLRAAIETPLGPLLEGVRLRDICRRDRLDELQFELPLAGGDEPSGEFAVGEIGAVLLDRLPTDDPLFDYARRLDELGAGAIRGYLTGSIDAVVRVPHSSGSRRLALVDYKTNWLAPPGDVLAPWHYRPRALALEMQRAHYGLQAILYTVALHRYLRWRLPDYDPDLNLGGAFYLFLRGMIGADTPVIDGTPCGVFGWRPPTAVVEALSDVLDGRSAR